MPSNGDFGIVIKNKKTEELVLVERGEFQTEVCGAAYFKWKCNTEQDTRKLDDGWKEEITHSCLLLPRLDGNGKPEQNHLYYMITSKWLEMHRDGTIRLPKGHCSDDGGEEMTESENICVM